MFNPFRLGLCLLVTVCLHAPIATGQEKFSLSTPGLFNTIPVSEIKLPSTSTKKPSGTKVPVQKLVCPHPIRIPIFSLPCDTERDCRIFGGGLACCKQRCIKGVLVPVSSVRKARISNSIQDPLTKPKKPTTTSTTTTTTTTTSTTTTTTTQSSIRNVTKSAKTQNLVCPSSDVRPPIFSLPCDSTGDCKIFGPGLVCCRRRCLQGIAPPKPEVKHALDRKCPAQPLTEILEIKECSNDDDCRPRICCPEKGSVKAKSYCRTPAHTVDRLPGGKRIEEPLRSFASYLQCTPPPPLDLFPRPCKAALDCFPNLCCQEGANRVCRPPRRSLISLFTDVTTRFGASEATKKFIQRITN
ncbi:PREDICTED: uncharacterized protein LOC108562465 isoform X2 [Nicrophorus vespilloides]|uniref:Uncharacterized protein LOC108562465 isoform X2 n=1 Tax=Nicrophorus vespilloides TaxID=110193 RepID=A0ABM1MP05_NICVS|nr:PREDICTED: uncharacterized protein LOC108562465 isoform X2 [Nicrophorus vespilloides]